MGTESRSHSRRLLAAALAILLGLGMVPGLISSSSVSAQADELSQRDYDDLVEEATSEDPAYGPEDGELLHDPDRVTFEYADVELDNFYVSVTFENPYAASSNQFDYGIQFRSHDDDGEARFLRFILISDGTWGLTDGTEDVLETDTYRDIDDSRRGENTMSVYADGDVVHLGINGDYIGTFEVTFDVEGEIAVGTSFLAESFVEDEETAYADFTIWELGGGSSRQDPEEEETPDPEEEETPVDGTQYESPTYGYTLVIGDEWEVTTDESDDDSDNLELSNGVSSVQLLSYASADTPAECIEGIINSLSEDPAMANLEVALDENDDELQGEDDISAFVVLNITYEAEGGDVDFTSFYRCYQLADGDALLQVSHLTLAEDYNGEIEARATLLDTLEIEGGSSRRDDEEEDPDPVPTEEGTETDLPEGSVTFLLEPAEGGSDLVFGTLVPDGSETTVELLALASTPGDYEVTIHEGSCRTPGEPAFELGVIDATGLLTATVDLPVEDLTSGDYVMIVSDGGDFENDATACGVLEALPVE